MKNLILLIPLLLSGCPTVQPTGPQIPNFVQVDRGIWRGGQPMTPAAWSALKAMGVTNVVKLNTWDEGSDSVATNLSMTVSYFPITLEEQMIPGKLGMHKVNEAVASITRNTFVHCEHGQDRTGLIIAAWREQHGWTKDAAEKEMLSLGFHKTLLGLWGYWEHTP